jgi:hypothetical protein
VRFIVDASAQWTRIGRIIKAERKTESLFFNSNIKTLFLSESDNSCETAILKENMD